jgi:flavin reductase (DIM6/NTAB) family NADH-FMN oxidoreductase RutF
MVGIVKDDVIANFKSAMRRVPAAVTVVTSADATRRHGMTATAVTSLSMDPPSLVVCLNRATLLHDIMSEGRRFCVNVLRRDQVALSAAFSGALPPDKRFDVGSWDLSSDGLHFLTNAKVNLFCRRVAAVPFGSHSIFIGEVERVLVRDPIEPLIYQNAAYCSSTSETVLAF